MALDRQRWTTGGAAVDCAAPWRRGAVAGAAGRAGGFFGAAGFVVVAVGLVSAGAPAAAGGGASSAGSTVSFWICFSSARSLATFF